MVGFGACTLAPIVREVRFSKEQSLPLDATYWEVVYDGDGSVEFQPGGIFLRPRSPKDAQDTVAALVVSRLSPRQDDFRLRVRYQVERQLRQNHGTNEAGPRPWEVFWLFWGYREGHSPAFKQTNYFILKPNGVELGRAFRKTEQTFLVTGPTPNLVFQHSHEIVLTRISSRISIEVDGQRALQFANRRWPQGVYRQNGKIGLYVEDAAAIVSGVWIAYPETESSQATATM